MEETPSFYMWNNNQKIPVMGLGTADMTNSKEVVYESIKSGTRLIDAAAAYGNEEEIGEAIEQAINEKITTREELFVITKLIPYERATPEEAIKNSLKRLKLSYVNLYWDHWPSCPKFKHNREYQTVPLHILWANMEKLVDLGYTKSIGVCNYNTQSMVNLLSFCRIKPAILEVEFHPYLYQKKLLEYCERENIRLIAYNSLVKGPYCEKHHQDKVKIMNLLEDPIVKELAVKYGKTPGQIAWNWSICLGVIVIPRTSNPKRMEENLKSATFRMDKIDVERISSLNQNYRFLKTQIFESFKNIDLFA